MMDKLNGCIKNDDLLQKYSIWDKVSTVYHKVF